MQSFEGPPRIDTSKYRPNEATPEQRAKKAEADRVMDRRKQAMLDVWEGRKQDELVRREGVQSIREKIASLDQTPQRTEIAPRQPESRQPAESQIDRMQELQRLSKPPFGDRVKDFFRNIFG